jgi:hypothetical protein
LRKNSDSKEGTMSYTTEDGLRVEGSLDPDPELERIVRERENSQEEPVRWEELREHLGL